jgi:hypothetical protein
VGKQRHLPDISDARLAQGDRIDVVDALRGLMITGAVVENGIFVDMFIMTLTVTVLILIAGRAYPRVAR